MSSAVVGRHLHPIRRWLVETVAACYGLGVQWLSDQDVLQLAQHEGEVLLLLRRSFWQLSKVESDCAWWFLIPSKDCRHIAPVWSRAYKWESTPEGGVWCSESNERLSTVALCKRVRNYANWELALLTRSAVPITATTVAATAVNAAPYPHIFMHALDLWYEHVRPLDVADEYRSRLGLRLFSFDAANDGRGTKGYIVASSAERLWDTVVERLAPHRRCFYQVILPNEPCGLYLDVEWLPEFNSQLEGHYDRVLDSLFYFVQLALGECYDADVGACFTRENTLVLSACQPNKKASFHLTCNSVVFDNILALRQFVTHLLTLVETSMELPDGEAGRQAALLYASDAKGTSKCVIDGAPYNQRQAWRLAGQRKRGQPDLRALRNDPQFNSLLLSDDTPRTLFLASMVTNVRPPYGNALPMLDDATATCARGGRKSVARRSSSSTHGRAAAVVTGSSSSSNNSSSMVPDLHQWAVNQTVDIIRSYNPTCRVKCKYNDFEQRVLVQCSGAHQCLQRSGPHNSNNMYAVIHLRQSKAYFHCYDSFCQDEGPVVVCLDPPEEQLTSTSVHSSTVDNGISRPFSNPTVSCDSESEFSSTASYPSSADSSLGCSSYTQSSSVVPLSSDSSSTCSSSSLLLPASPSSPPPPPPVLAPVTADSPLFLAIHHAVQHVYGHSWQPCMLHWKNALVVEFGVRAGDTAQSLCPVYEMLQLGDRGHLNHKRGTVFRHSLRLAHDILLVENAAVSVRFSVYCTCRYVSRPSPREGRSAAPVVVPLRHDLEYLPAIACDRLGDRVQQELRQLHLDAIRREAEQLLLPQELIGNPHIHVCPLDQSFVSELDLPTSAAYPLECSRLTIAIRSATGTGKSTLIRRITSPLDPLLDLLELWQFPHPRGEPFDIGFLISRWLPLRFGPHSSQPPLCLFVHAKTRQQLFWIRCMLPREQQENMRVPPQAADHPEWDDSQWRDEWFSWLCEVVLQGALRLQLEPVSNDDGRCLWCIREQSFEALLEQWGSVPRYSSRLQRDPRSQRVDSVMFLSALRSIATSIEAAYGVVNYMNHFGYNGGTSESFALIRRVVCSLESVNKCLRPRYFTVVIDEVETLLGRAHSKTMGRDAERSQKLQHAFYFMRRAGVLLLAEFSLSRETLALALKLRPPTANSPLVLYYNVYSGRRPAVKLLLPKSGEDVHEPLRRVAVTMARANAFRAPNVAPVPMVVACQSKAFGREIAKIFRQYDPHAPTLFIHNAHDERERPVSESPDDPDREELQQRAMHDPTHEWCKYRYVIFTTKVLAALDCNPLVPYFGIMLSQGDRGFTGLAEHLIQQEGRSRTLTSNVILRTTSTASAAMNRRPLCTDAHVIREHLLANSEQERALYNRLVGGIFSDEPHINSADGLLEPTYVIGNENELNLFLNNVVRERRTLNDPRDRSLQLSHDAGSGIELLVPDDVEWLLRRLFPELVLEGLDDEVPRMAADNESLSQEQWAHAIVHAVPSAEQQRAYDLRTFHVRTESERYVWQHMSVQRCLGTSTLTGELSEESLVKDVMFAMGRTAHQQVRLFLLLKNDIGHATTVAEHHPSSDGSLLSQRHPLLVRGIMMDLLRIGGFRAVDDDRHVLCQSYANHWNVVGNLQQYVQHLPLPQVEELTALQKIRLALLNVSDWKSCLQLFRLFFQLVGLALGKCHDSRGGVAKAGYQLEYDSVRRMREIHERTAFGTVAPLTMFTLRFEATTRAALAVVTDQQHLHVDGGLDPIRSLVQVLAVHFVDLGLSPHPLPAAHNWVHRSISTPPLTFDAGFPSLDWFVNRWQASEESLVVLRRTQEDADDRIRLHECVGFALILHKNCFFVSATCNSATSVSLVCELLHAPLSLSAACLEYAQNHCGGNDAIQHAEVWPV